MPKKASTKKAAETTPEPIATEPVQIDGRVHELIESAIEKSARDEIPTPEELGAAALLDRKDFERLIARRNGQLSVESRVPPAEQRDALAEEIEEAEATHVKRAAEIDAEIERLTAERDAGLSQLRQLYERQETIERAMERLREHPPYAASKRIQARTSAMRNLRSRRGRVASELGNVERFLAIRPEWYGKGTEQGLLRQRATYLRDAGQRHLETHDSLGPDDEIGVTFTPDPKSQAYLQERLASLRAEYDRLDTVVQAADEANREDRETLIRRIG